MYQDVYDFAVISNYPELKDYLVEKLSKLGKIRIWNQFGENHAHYVVEIEFNEFHKVYDWRVEHPVNVLYINSDAGGCFLRGANVNCSELPKSDSRKAKFTFGLTLDSREIPVSEHDPKYVMETINKFVFLANNGFCYHFKNR